MNPPSSDAFLPAAAADLPVTSALAELDHALSHQPSAVLCAPPGSGKTTAVPLALLESGWLEGRSIVMLEPRRLAARAAARRMASLLGEAAGERVGYQVRFDRKVGSKTRIEVVTEGILTRRLQSDPSLPGVGLVIFDEFHERSLHADLALALCLDAREAWCEDLRVLVMSATLDAGPVAQLLGDAPVIEAKGRQFPVEVRYRERPTDVRDAGLVARAALNALAEQDGDVLTFLPGAGEIRAVERALDEAQTAREVVVCPLYGDLSAEAQDQAILPVPGKRRIVLATNIAQTSLTIEGIGAVVDTGQARRPYFDPNTGLSRLTTVGVSAAAAEQRAGRAGRLGPGICWRLWTESEQRARTAFDPPEIETADLCALLLELYAWGINDPLELTWLSPPPNGPLAQARDLLISLDALDDRGRVTALGTEMAKLPAHPRLARMLLAAKAGGAEQTGCDLAALLDGPDVVSRDEGADLNERLDVLRRYRRKSGGSLNARAARNVDRAARQFLRQLSGTSDVASAEDSPGALLLQAFPDRLAQRRAGSRTHYRLVNGRALELRAPDRLGEHEYLVVPDLDAGQRTGRIYRAAVVSADELSSLAERYGVDETLTGWNVTEEMVEARTVRRIGALELESRTLSDVDESALDAAMLDGIRTMGLSSLPWTKEQLELRLRGACLRRWNPDAGMPALDDQSLLESLNDWLAPFLNRARRRSHLSRIDLDGALHTLLPYPVRQRLEQLVPSHYEVPSGSRIHITYEAEGPPVLAVKLQEMFGAPTTPAICDGAVPLLIHLLSPAGRPLQVTQDLAAFWESAYPEVRKEMRGRYPKHPWPEDPRGFTPTRLTNRALKARGKD